MKQYQIDRIKDFYFANKTVDMTIILIHRFLFNLLLKNHYTICF